MCLVEEVVKDSLGLYIKLEAKVLEPTDEHVKIYEHNPWFVRDQSIFDEYTEYQLKIEKLEIAEK